ncbi:MAG: hypothetical protein OXE77_01880 [Flavobacteriaceae bacterium]|nr:hypothetical protein [Flavobacteriaceae bacterium]
MKWFPSIFGERLSHKTHELDASFPWGGYRNCYWWYVNDYPSHLFTTLPKTNPTSQRSKGMELKKIGDNLVQVVDSLGGYHHIHFIRRKKEKSLGRWICHRTLWKCRPNLQIVEEIATLEIYQGKIIVGLILEPQDIVSDGEFKYITKKQLKKAGRCRRKYDPEMKSYIRIDRAQEIEEVVALIELACEKKFPVTE